MLIFGLLFKSCINDLLMQETVSNLRYHFDAELSRAVDAAKTAIIAAARSASDELLAELRATRAHIHTSALSPAELLLVHPQAFSTRSAQNHPHAATTTSVIAPARAREGSGVLNGLLAGQVDPGQADTDSKTSHQFLHPTPAAEAAPRTLQRWKSIRQTSSPVNGPPPPAATVQPASDRISSAGTAATARDAGRPDGVGSGDTRRDKARGRLRMRSMPRLVDHRPANHAGHAGHTAVDDNLTVAATHHAAQAGRGGGLPLSGRVHRSVSEGCDGEEAGRVDLVYVDEAHHKPEAAAGGRHPMGGGAAASSNGADSVDSGKGTLQTAGGSYPAGGSGGGVRGEAQ